MASDETALVQELRALGRVAPDDRNRFAVHHGAHTIEVVYVGGSTSSLTLQADYDRVARADHPALVGREAAGGYRDARRRPLAAPRPMAIELRRETSDDRAAKREGLSVEWQSDDEVFDRTVYVSTPLADAEVLAAMLGPEVRRGVLQLLELGFRTVTIDEDGRVHAYLNEFTSATPRPKRGADAIEAFSTILSNLPAVAASGKAALRAPLATWTILLSAIGIVGWGTNVGYAMGVMALSRVLIPHAIDDPPTAVQIVAVVVAAISVGVVGSGLYANAVRARVQGTSRAHEMVFKARVAAFGGVSVLAFTILFLALIAANAR